MSGEVELEETKHEMEGKDEKSDGEVYAEALRGESFEFDCCWRTLHGTVRYEGRMILCRDQDLSDREHAHLYGSITWRRLCATSNPRDEATEEEFYALLNVATREVSMTTQQQKTTSLDGQSVLRGHNYKLSLSADGMVLNGTTCAILSPAETMAWEHPEEGIFVAVAVPLMLRTNPRPTDALQAFLDSEATDKK